MVTELPSGTVTFLFTDIADSTPLMRFLGEAYEPLLAQHHAQLRAAIAEHGGTEVKSGGDGLFVAFACATDAVAAAVQAQRSLTAYSWPEDAVFRVRMGVHTGEAQAVHGDYVSLAVNQAQRISAAGHGGQILLSGVTASLVETLPTGVRLEDLGEHRLRGFGSACRLFQVTGPGLRDEFPPPRTEESRRHNLPLPVTRFVGRQRELAAVRDLLANTRLFTITGTGGCGKTRLALEAAWQLTDDHPDGVWLVELADLTDESLVPGAVAAVWRLPEETGRPLLDTVVNHVRDLRLVLLLDNCEHLLSACARLAQRVLQTAPGVCILATSREPLGAPGETTWTIPPLGPSEAAELFVDRARSAHPDFAPSEEDVGAVAEICRRLDGIPLAVEIAAVRVRSLSPGDIAASLDRRFEVLVGGARTAVPHHRTLRALVQWSEELLSPAERTLFFRISIFAGNFTLPAAEEVCGGAVVLPQLVDKSLVVYEGRRYRMLETIREYAREHLAQSDEAGLRARHYDWFLARARQGNQGLHGIDAALWLDELEADHDDFRQALQWSESEGRLEAALTLAAELRWFWIMRGHGREGRRFLDQAVSRSSGVSAGVRASVLHNAADFAFGVLGDLSRARALWEESVNLWRDVEDRRGLAVSLSGVGLAARAQGDQRGAGAAYAEALAVAKELGDEEAKASAVAGLGDVAYDEGDLDTARRLYEQAKATFGQVGQAHGVGQCLLNLGDLRRRALEPGAARAAYEEALPIFDGLQDGNCRAATFERLAALAWDEGDVEASGSLYADALSLRRAAGQRGPLVTALEGIASVQAVRGHGRRAARIFAAAAFLREATSSPEPTREPVARAISGLSEEERRAAEEEGTTLPLDLVVAEALSG